MREGDPREKARTGTNACGKREGKPRNDPSLEDKKQKFQAIGPNATDREAALSPFPTTRACNGCRTVQTIN